MCSSGGNYFNHAAFLKLFKSGHKLSFILPGKYVICFRKKIAVHPRQIMIMGIVHGTFHLFFTQFDQFQQVLTITVLEHRVLYHCQQAGGD